MKPIFKIAGVVATLVVLFLPEIADAYVPAGVAHMHRATRRRTAVVVSSATHEKDEEAAAQQQAATSETQTAPADTTKQTTTSTPPPAVAPAPTPVAAGEPLPLGTVVSALPSGCTTTTADNVEYYHCGADYYRSAFQGNTLVYVTTAAP